MPATPETEVSTSAVVGQAAIFDLDAVLSHQQQDQASFIDWNSAAGCECQNCSQARAAGIQAPAFVPCAHPIACIDRLSECFRCERCDEEIEDPQHPAVLAYEARRDEETARHWARASAYVNSVRSR